MNPSQPTAGRARGRGRGLYVHPEPEHVKDPNFVGFHAHFYEEKKNRNFCFEEIKFWIAFLFQFESIISRNVSHMIRTPKLQSYDQKRRRRQLL